MKKDGLAEKIRRRLHDAYDTVLDERIPERFEELLAQLK